jgi:copper(I)-binding protein
MLFLIITLVSVFILPPGIQVSSGKKIDIKAAWVRTGAEGLNSALYFKIENNTDRPDTLYEVTSDIARHIMMHETYKKNDMMGMREIKDIVIKPGSSVEFKPGGYHVMLMELNKDLKEGNETNFTLLFKLAGEINIKAKVENK